MEPIQASNGNNNNGTRNLEDMLIADEIKHIFKFARRKSLIALVARIVDGLLL
jgi:hypothetical protein